MNNFNVHFLTDVFAGVWHGTLGLILLGSYYSKGYLTLRRLMSYIYIYIYIYGAPILDVSRSHTTTQHSR